MNNTEQIKVNQWSRERFSWVCEPEVEQSYFYNMCVCVCVCVCVKSVSCCWCNPPLQTCECKLQDITSNPNQLTRRKHTNRPRLHFSFSNICFEIWAFKWKQNTPSLFMNLCSDSISLTSVSVVFNVPVKPDRLLHHTRHVVLSQVPFPLYCFYYYISADDAVG